MKKIFLALGSTLLLASCAYDRPPVPYVKPEVIEFYNFDKPRNEVDIEYDEFRRVTTYRGSSIQIYDTKTNIEDRFFLRAFKSNATSSSSNISYQIYVVDTYEGKWRRHQEAYDSRGEELAITQIDRDVNCGRVRCIYTETVGVKVTLDYLVEHIKEGIRFQISGPGGKEAFFLPGEYIENFLKAVESY